VRLTAVERGWLGVIFEAILPDGPADPVPARDRDAALGRLLDDLAGRAPTQVMLGLRAAAFTAWWVAPWLATGRPQALGGLPRDRRAAAIEALARSDRYVLRETPVLLKTFAALAYGASPSTRRLLGGEDTP